MFDTIEIYSPVDAVVIRILLDLGSHEPNQKKDIEHTFWNMINGFRDKNIRVHDAEVYSNEIATYQVEWLLLGSNARHIGTLVFGRKLPTTYGQDPLRKFWVRSPNGIELSDDLMPVSLTEYFDNYLYFHDLSEAQRLNRYSHGSDEVIYRHESTRDKNPNWFSVSVVFSEQDTTGLSLRL